MNFNFKNFGKRFFKFLWVGLLGILTWALLISAIQGSSNIFFMVLLFFPLTAAALIPYAVAATVLFSFLKIENIKFKNLTMFLYALLTGPAYVGIVLLICRDCELFSL